MTMFTTVGGMGSKNSLINITDFIKAYKGNILCILYVVYPCESGVSMLCADCLSSKSLLD